MKKILILLLVHCFCTNALADEGGGYLFATFRGEASPMTEQIYFMISEDGYDWQALNNKKPVLTSALGEKGVRDPYIIRSHDNKKFYLIATDLSIHLNPDWERAQTAGSQSIVVWESEDLVRWSTPRLVKVAPDNAGCTWAPEAIYDPEKKAYMVFWASKTADDDYAKHRIWAAHTQDFKTFSKPFVYMEKPNTVIDTTIVKEGDTFYRFTKDEKHKAISMEKSEHLMRGWKTLDNFSLKLLKGYEGPASFMTEPARDNQPATWSLLLDFYSKGQGYQSFETDDLSSGNFKEGKKMKFPFHPVRHGTVIALTKTEYARIKTVDQQQTSTTPQTHHRISERFNADPSAHVYDNTFYVYATNDQDNSGSYWDSTDWQLFSSADLKQWKDEGSFLNVEVFKWADKNAKAWAPGAIQHGDTYYFFAPVGGKQIGVATSKTPRGPFVDPINKPLIETPRDANAGDEPIDPMVFIDKDQQAYMYFGTRIPKVVKLSKNLLAARGKIENVVITGFPVDDPRKQYGEAPYLHEHKGTYYFSFSTGWPGQIVYATGDSPMGPFQYRGVIFDYLPISTNHHAIVSHQGENWFFYHDGSLPGGGDHKRSIRFAALNYDANGEIIPIALSD